MAPPKMKHLFFLIYAFLLLIPGYTILTSAPLDEIFKSPPDTIYLFLRLAALYGVTLLFIQIVLGAFMQKFIGVFGAGALKWHTRQGIITYGIVLSHPLLYTIYSWQTLNFFNPIKIFWPNFSVLNEYYISFGRLALYLLTIGVFFGIFRNRPALIHHWRKFHFANYIAFAFVLFHSWNIGSDIHTPPFVFLYPIFITGLLIALFYRRIYRGLQELSGDAKRKIATQ